MPAPAGDDNWDAPRRRASDSPTYRDMVEYYAQQSEREHVARAEIVMQMSNALERFQASMTDTVAEMKRQMNAHEVWHRDYLQRLIEQQPSTDNAKANLGLQRTMLAFAGIALLVSVVSVIAAFVR